jgi:uncharacterized protein (TIGR00255 family)
MIKSMTGFASLAVEGERAAIGVTIRGVNHRYLDVQVRTPASLAGLEARLRALVQLQVSRGRVELAVAVQHREPPAPEVELNQAFVSRLSDAIEKARARGAVEGKLTPGDLVRLPQALVIKEQPVDPDSAELAELEANIESAVERAVGQLDLMRVGEGQHLKEDLDRRRVLFAGLVERIQAAAELGRENLQQRLAARVTELSGGLQPDPAAIAQEIVRTAARSDISEEVVRLRTHLAQWDAMVGGDEACGRKLDFLIQEMNREINTIAAKSDGVSVSELIVEAKAELEKMREQVQNVE